MENVFVKLDSKDTLVMKLVLWDGMEKNARQSANAWIAIILLGIVELSLPQEEDMLAAAEMFAVTDTFAAAYVFATKGMFAAADMFAVEDSIIAGGPIITEDFIAAEDPIAVAIIADVVE